MPRVFGWAGTQLVTNGTKLPAMTIKVLQAAGSTWRNPSQLSNSVISGLCSGRSRCSNIVLQIPLALDFVVQIGSILTSCSVCLVFGLSGAVWRMKTEIFMGFWAYGTAYSLLHSPPPWAQSLLWPDKSTHLTPTLANYGFPAMSSEYSNVMGFLANSFVGIPLACSWGLPKYGLNVSQEMRRGVIELCLEHIDQLASMQPWVSPSVLRNMAQAIIWSAPRSLQWWTSITDTGPSPLSWMVKRYFNAVIVQRTLRGELPAP